MKEFYVTRFTHAEKSRLDAEGDVGRAILTPAFFRIRESR